MNFMHLSSRKGAHAVLSSASRQEIRVREMAKKCELSELIRLLRGFFGLGGLFFRQLCVFAIDGGSEGGAGVLPRISRGIWWLR